MQTQALVICGRDWGGFRALGDYPAPGLGPIGGLCAALQHATAAGFDAVLLAPCDLLGIPPDTVERLSPGPAVVDGQWLLGLWPAALLPQIKALTMTEGAISLRRLVHETGARAIGINGLRNINFLHDLG